MPCFLWHSLIFLKYGEPHELMGSLPINKLKPALFRLMQYYTLQLSAGGLPVLPNLKLSLCVDSCGLGMSPCHPILSGKLKALPCIELHEGALSCHVFSFKVQWKPATKIFHVILEHFYSWFLIFFTLLIT